MQERAHLGHRDRSRPAVAAGISHHESQALIIGTRKEVVVVAAGRVVHHILDSNAPALERWGMPRHEVMLECSDLLHFQLKGPVAGSLLAQRMLMAFHGCSLRTERSSRSRER